MSLKRVTTVLAALVVLAGFGFGLDFLLNPQAAAGFGITPWPQGEATGYFVVKGVRDLAYGLVALILLLHGQRRLLGWVVLADAIIPLGDCLAVMTHGGTVGYALAVHGSAAVLVLITAALLLREKPQVVSAQ
ncbi:DUF4267 domain-containing protein [Kutzneria viridogrisea]|uniref:DUF4267 domain-containing protein n=2 Tax=Kutzneria TaxID=43356 RepID=A0ABR6BV86_9PSEU|nr:DUF4267 domain-containing protein [Kutzneria albida]AHH97264.1 putative secreted protein [Kutzneria albida DSM 43870]MBA8930822.1 hypothetical protein [Kutzneria viridogrisea]